MLSWSELHQRSAAAQAIRDSDSMKFIVEHTDEDIRTAYRDLTSLGSPSFDGLPSAKNPQAAEEHVADGIDEIDTMRERYRQAVEYMKWFQPAWDELDEEERYVLTAFFGSRYGDGAAESVGRHLNVERSTAYRKKDHALDHLATLLYGRL
mgnify:CR=1 FL=1